MSGNVGDGHLAFGVEWSLGKGLGGNVHFFVLNRINCKMDTICLFPSSLI